MKQRGDGVSIKSMTKQRTSKDDYKKIGFTYNKHKRANIADFTPRDKNINAIWLGVIDKRINIYTFKINTN